MTDNEREQIDGQRARAILADDLVVRSFAEVERLNVAAWRAATTMEEREECWRRLKTLEAFQSQLELIVNNGVFAEMRAHSER